MNQFIISVLRSWSQLRLGFAARLPRLGSALGCAFRAAWLKQDRFTAHLQPVWCWSLGPGFSGCYLVMVKDLSALAPVRSCLQQGTASLALSPTDLCVAGPW